MKMSISLSLWTCVCGTLFLFLNWKKRVNIQQKVSFHINAIQNNWQRINKNRYVWNIDEQKQHVRVIQLEKKCQSDSSIRVEIVFVFIRCLKNPHSGKHSKKIILPLVQHFHSIWILTAQNLTHRRNYSWNIIIQDMKCIPKSFLTIILAWCFKFMPLLLVHIKSSNSFFILC